MCAVFHNRLFGRETHCTTCRRNSKDGTFYGCATASQASRRTQLQLRHRYILTAANRAVIGKSPKCSILSPQTSHYREIDGASQRRSWNPSLRFRSRTNSKCMTKWCILRPGKIRVLKRADLASSEAATSRCPSKRRYLNVPTTSPAVRHKRAPASTGWGLSLLIVHPEGYRYGPISRGDSRRGRRGRSGARLFSARFLRPMVP
jgi:hypothetical protein